MPTLNVRLLTPESKPPQKSSSGAACFDLYATSETVLKGAPYIEYSTGIAVSFDPEYVALIFPRSSISNTGAVLANSTGVIDSDYRGEIKLRFYIPYTPPYKVGDRIGQLMLIRKEEVEINVTDELDWTVRGTGGFGSSGV